MATIYRNFLSGTLSADPGAAGTTLNASNFASLPVVASPDTMWLVLDPDGTSGAPEVVQVTAHTASATSVTVVRAQQSTTGRAHAIGTVWRVAVTSTDLDELPFRKLTTAGDLLYGSAANTATRLAIGSSGLPLTSTGTAPSWAQLGTSGIADSAVTTAKIGAAAVTAAKLAADTAGNGLTQAAGGALQVNPDGATLELSADAVRVKDGGITLAKLAADSVDASKIVNDTITVNEIANDAVTVSKILQGTAGQVLMTNGTPDTVWATLSGDVTVNGSGQTAIAAGAIMDADVNASANIAYSKLNLAGMLVAGDFGSLAKPTVICTSSTRPTTGVVEGQLIYETDTDRIYVATDTTPTWQIVHGNVSALGQRTAGLAIANGATTTLTFATETDPDGLLSSTTFTAPHAGNYSCTINITAATDMAAGLGSTINHTGLGYRQQLLGAEHTFTIIDYMAAGETTTWEISNATGASLTYAYTAIFRWLGR